MNERSGHSQFAVGVLSAVLALLAVGITLRAAAWVVTYPQPEAFVEALQVARFSILDVLTGVLVLSTARLAVWTVAHGRGGGET